MPVTDLTIEPVARVYAEALLQLADAAGLGDEVLEGLATLTGLLDGVPGLEEYFASPLVDAGRKAKLLDERLRSDAVAAAGPARDLIVDCLQVMNRKGRLPLLRDLIAAYEEAYDAARDIAGGRVVTAAPLTEEQRQQVSTAAARLSGKRVHLHEVVDPGLLGGLVLYLGDRKFDTSVRRRVEDLSHTFTDRISREMHEGAATYVEGSADADTASPAG